MLDGSEMLDFDQIARQYQKQIYYFCLRILRNHHDSDEATQKTFMKAYEKIGTFRGDASIKTWLYKIALNVCRNEIRARKNTVELSDNQEDGSKTALDRTIQKQQHTALSNTIAKLPQKQREVIVLRVNQEHSFREIADILNISENSAKVNFHHGITKLKEIISSPSGENL